ncbi:hypothetical protein [Thiomicrorhabdus lithotrophica]|uniref:Phage protein n=1 Tax=Thiomicrorhabdus lithotrophica TaxID=2949997 RepID=A0ABY8CBY6_9GAMM|nr:hypothetical protein [Thiomicrorhabdus lithotrophica]WEJ62190.1 hypothetical protein NR989_09230 [Thiomicrorhabdus lithotrophica]
MKKYLLVTNTFNGKVLGVYSDKNIALEDRNRLRSDPSYVGQFEKHPNATVLKVKCEVVE